MAETEIDELREQLARLEAENATLRVVTAPPAPLPPAKRRREPGLWRAFASALCIVIATILVPLSIVGAWARVQLVDEEAFVSTFAPLADDPDVQALIIDKASTAVSEAVDVQSLTDQVFDGFASLDLPPRAESALELLRQPAADGVESLIDGAITKLVESDAFSVVWEKALHASHKSLVAIATNDGSGAVSIGDEGQIGIALGPIIEDVKTALVDRGIAFASNIPEVNRTIVVAEVPSLVLISSIYAIAVTIGVWLPLIALFFFVVGILFARRRSTAVLGTGVGMALGAGALAVILTGAGTVLSLSAANLGIPSHTLDTIYYAVVGAMRDTAIVLTFLGIVIAVTGWLAGRWAPAARVRTVAGSLTAGARDSLQRRGMHTGRFGAWLHQQRTLVRFVILALTLLLMFLLRPLSFGDIVLTVVLGLLVWLVAELLQRGPDPVPDPLADPLADEPGEPGEPGEPSDAEPVVEVVVVEPAPEFAAVSVDASVPAPTGDAEGGPVEASAPPKPPRPKRTSS